MIVGTVSSNYEAVVSITVSAPNGQQINVEGLIDTGFNGHLTLPTELISELGLQSVTQYEVRLGDGTSQHVDVYDALVELGDGIRRNVLVEPAEVKPLIGMALMRGYDLHIEVVEDGAVTIESL